MREEGDKEGGKVGTVTPFLKILFRKKGVTVPTLMLIIIVFSAPVYSLVTVQDGDWKLKFTGYIKNVTTYTEPIDFPVNILLGIPEPPFFSLGEIEEDEHWDNLTRLRLKLAGRRGGTYAWELQWELRGVASPPDLMLPGFLGAGAGVEQWQPMHATIFDEPGFEASQNLDRAWCSWSPDWVRS